MNEGQLTGTIIKILEPRRGTSKNTGKDFFVQEYIVETQEEYPTKVHFSVFGEDRVKGYNLKQGDTVQVFFYVNSREFNDRWYTDIRVRNIVKIDAGQMAGAQTGTPYGQPMGNFGPQPQAPQGMPGYGGQAAPQCMPGYGAQQQPYGPQQGDGGNGGGVDDLPF